VSTPLLVIDAANVVGSVPDGWWRDRAGATTRLRDSLAGLSATGLPQTGSPIDVMTYQQLLDSAARSLSPGRDS